MIIPSNSPPPAAEGKKESLLNRFKTALRGSTSAAAAKSGTQNENGMLSGLLFGVPLEIIADLGPPLMSNRVLGVPLFIESAFQFLKDSEKETEGVFRLSGSSATIKEYKKALDNGGQISWQAGRDSHNAAGLIKMYLRELPEPLLTFELWESFCRVVKVVDDEQKCQFFTSILQALPIVNYNLLKFILGELFEFSKFEEKTKMGISNLGTLFGPNIGRPHTNVDDQAEMLMYTSKATAICIYLITNYNQLFIQDAKPIFRAIATASFDFEPTEDEEVSLAADDVVFVTEQDGEWWNGFVINSDGVLLQGKFPVNYVLVIRTIDKATAISLDSRRCSPREMTGEDEPILDIFSSDANLEDHVEDNSYKSSKTISTKSPSLSRSLTLEQTDLNTGGLDPNANEADLNTNETDPNANETDLNANETFGVHDIANFSERESQEQSPSIIVSPSNASMAERLASLEAELAVVKLELAEEKRQREQLGQVVPELMKNQDEVLKLLQVLNHTR